MKNLKKVLSLSLALVMLLGMMIMPQANAAGMTYKDLVDKDDIKNLDAVALLVDLGIIEGKTGNVYDPAGIVDRATMAKLVTLLHFGNVDPNQFLGTTSDLTDIKGNWAEGYILYCYTQGIIAGDGMGKFFPANEVTVAEAAKMLLVTLGYDANKAGLVGADWAVNTISTATGATILSGIGLRASDKLDRDTLAQMMYNTLFSNQVAYNTLFGNDPISKNNTLGLATYGLLKITGLVNTATDKDFTFETTTIEYEPELPTGAITRVRLGNQEAFIGKYASVYVQVKTTMTNAGSGWQLAATVTATNEVLKVYSSELTLADTNVIVSTNGTNLFKLFVDKGFVSKLDIDGTTVNTKFYYNDLPVTVTSTDLGATNMENYYKATIGAKPAPNLATISTSAADALFKAAAKKGNVVQISDLDNDGLADIVYVTDYTAAKVTRVTSTNITFSVAFGGERTWKVEEIVGADGLKVDDYVYGYVDSNDKLLLQAPSSVDAKITREGTSNIIADGKTYEFAGFGLVGTGSSMIDPGKEVTLFLDTYGYVVAADLIDEATSIAFVVNHDGLGGVAPQIRLLLTDGTTVVARIDKVVDTLGDPVTSGSIQYEVVKYSVSDAGYKITQISGWNPTTGATIAPKEADIDGHLAGDNTVFIDGENKTTYTGYKNIPTFDMSGTAEGAVYTKAGDATASFVFISGAKNTMGVDGLFVVFSTSAGYSKGDKVFSLNVITANGVESKTFDERFDPRDTTLANRLLVGNIYNATATKTVNGEAGIIDTVGTARTWSATPAAVVPGQTKYSTVYGQIAANGTGVVQVGTATFQITNDTAIFEVEADGSNYKAVDAGSLDSYWSDGEFTRNITVIYDNGGTITTKPAVMIIVQETEISLIPVFTLATSAADLIYDISDATFVAPAAVTAPVTLTLTATNSGAVNGKAVTWPAPVATSTAAGFAVTPASGATTAASGAATLALTVTVTPGSVTAVDGDTIVYTFTSEGVTTTLTITVQD